MALRSLRGFLLLAGLVAFIPAFAQEQQQPSQPQPAPQPAPAPTPSPDPGGRTPTIPTPTPLPTPRQPQQEPDWRQQPFPEIQRPIFLSGRVVLEDGTPPPEPVVIERICHGQPRPEAYTDSRGRFSFQLGQNMHLMADASVNTADPLADPTRRSPGAGFGQPRTISERDLIGCELRAVLPGYRSDPVPLAGRRLMDNPDVGTIVLRRLAKVEGTVISATTLAAPKDARKAYEKGLEALKRKKLDEARKQLERAVALYPQYAVAWYELGRIHQEQNNREKAREAYGKALEADAKFMKPYLQLALLSAQDRNWQEVADTTDRLLRLDPFDYPLAYFFNSVANFNLRKLDAAERSAREGIKLDERNQIPKMRHLLGVILANKQDYAAAAELLRTYLPHAANPEESELVRKQLAEIERLAGLTGRQPPLTAPQP
ncbi:MAG: tetratricopeptide repeat protein [Bryobacterales bacterium]|nr:tetratricopeptide repeat protein [Bryobacteraceae bacterium]MDW8131326.1 tetratricopeptide repeat protein [Bryobacterales bacterium]